MTTSPATCDETIAELFGVLGGSLLQYLGEANPWTDHEHADARATLARLAESQRQSSAEVADLLARRHVLPDPLSFPSDFARLHYLALTFVLGRMIANQIGVVAAADAAIAACGRDPAVRTLRRVRDREAEHLAELKRLQDSLWIENSV